MQWLSNALQSHNAPLAIGTIPTSTKQLLVRTLKIGLNQRERTRVFTHAKNRNRFNLLVPASFSLTEEFLSRLLQPSKRRKGPGNMLKMAIAFGVMVDHVKRKPLDDLSSIGITGLVTIHQCHDEPDGKFI